MPTIKEVAQALHPISDPEIKVSIVELGLIYGIGMENGTVTVNMTLTTPACPYGPMLKEMVQKTVSQIPEVKEVQINLIWDPAWDPMKMASEEAKIDLGILW